MTPSNRPGGIAGYELWPREAAKARSRLYPATVLYTAYSVTLLAWALRTPHRLAAAAFFAGGVAAWTLLEYFVHRYILHGRFADGPGVVQHFLHKRFDPLHWEHHARPWDGEHINGRIMDTLPFSIALAALAALFPLWFRYIKRHHLYHHSPKGGDVGYGLTNGLWDIIFSTRISAEQRRLLYGRGKAEGHVLDQRQARAGPLSTA